MRLTQAPHGKEQPAVGVFRQRLVGGQHAGVREEAHVHGPRLDQVQQARQQALARGGPGREEGPGELLPVRGVDVRAHGLEADQVDRGARRGEVHGLPVARVVDGRAAGRRAFRRHAAENGLHDVMQRRRQVVDVVVVVSGGGVAPCAGDVPLELLRFHSGRHEGHPRLQGGREGVRGPVPALAAEPFEPLHEHVRREEREHARLRGARRGAQRAACVHLPEVDGLHTRTNDKTRWVSAPGRS